MIVPRPSSPGERRAEISGRAKTELSVSLLQLRGSGVEPRLLPATIDRRGFKTPARFVGTSTVDLVSTPARLGLDRRPDRARRVEECES